MHEITGPYATANGASYMRDTLHPRDNGYAVIANAIYRRIMS